jgi:hypothetical protein
MRRISAATGVQKQEQGLVLQNGKHENEQN